MTDLNIIDRKNLPSFPNISADANKKNRGHALIIAGSKEKSGAALLSSIASMRAGVGLCTLAVPSVAHAIIKSQLINVMSEEIPSNEQSVFESSSSTLISKWVENKTAVLIGPGLAPDPNRTKWIEKLLPDILCPLVIDAQALSDLASKISDIDFSKNKVVITPHPGEMSKLTGLSIEEIQKKRQEVAGTYSKQWNMVVVLKGHHTLIGFPSGTVWINQVDHPCLSVAGTGDVLAGILVSFLAQGLSIEDASRLAVYVHGSAGRRLGMRMGMRGVVATDLFNEIPQVIHEIDSNKTA